MENAKDFVSKIIKNRKCNKWNYVKKTLNVINVCVMELIIQADFCIVNVKNTKKKNKHYESNY